MNKGPGFEQLLVGLLTIFVIGIAGYLIFSPHDSRNISFSGDYYVTETRIQNNDGACEYHIFRVNNNQEIGSGVAIKCGSTRWATLNEVDVLLVTNPFLQIGIHFVEQNELPMFGYTVYSTWENLVMVTCPSLFRAQPDTHMVFTEAQLSCTQQ